MECLALLIVLALLALLVMGGTNCGRCRILCDGGSNEPTSKETLLPNRMPPWFSPFDAPSPPEPKIDQTLGQRLREKGWVFITSECQNCDPEDAQVGGAYPGLYVINAELEPDFALFAGVQQPPCWFNMKTGQLIPNILPHDALEVMAS